MFNEGLQSVAGGQLTIDLDALAGNFLRLRVKAAPADVAAVVKADAYGLGAEAVATRLKREGCLNFFVANLAEALALKAVTGPSCRLYVLNGLQPGEEAACAANRIVPVLNGLEQAWRWRSICNSLGVAMPAALQLDSGMGRLGLSAADVSTLTSDGRFFKEIDLVLVMSHLACAEDSGSLSNQRQLEQFKAMAGCLPATAWSLANSSGLLLSEAFHLDLARPGVALYGGADADERCPMHSVVHLTARVIQVRDVAPNTSVGYGLTYARASDGRLATIAVGYADGWPRRLSNRGAAYYRGIRLPIAGRVSMDSTILDVTALAQNGVSLELGDEVELIGPNQSLQDVAEAAETIPYEILTRLGRRYSRTYLDRNRLSNVSATTLSLDPCL